MHVYKGSREHKMRNELQEKKNHPKKGEAKHHHTIK